jgi:hypothetical protein
MTARTTAANTEAPAERAAERRQAPRYRCLSECLVRLEAAAEPLHWPGMVYNVSATGIGLALPFPALLGSVLLIEPARARSARRSLRARVVRCALREYVWFHGCEFLAPLSPGELGHWLDEFGGERPPRGR